MEYSPYQGENGHSGAQGVLDGTRRFITVYQNSQPLDLHPSQINPFHTLHYLAYICINCTCQAYHTISVFPLLHTVLCNAGEFILYVCILYYDVYGVLGIKCT